MTDTKVKYDIFFSYSYNDSEQVSKIANYFENQGLKVWFDKWLLVPGTSWEEALKEALESSSAVAVFIGSSPFSRRTQWELEASLKREISGRLQVIPVLLPGATRDNIPHHLRNLVAVDLRQGFENSRELDRFIAAIGHFDKEDLINHEMLIGDDLKDVGNHTGALEHYERALRIAVAVYGESHPLVATLLIRNFDSTYA